MNASELLRIVDAIHRDKNVEKEIVFTAIEAALVSAAKKQYGEEEDIVVQIDRKDGSISGTHNGVPLDPEETVGRIGAQTAKQVMIQKIREAERDALYDEYHELLGQMMTGVVQRYEGGAATVQLNNVEAILPRSEQIPGETHHPNERVRATVFEVRKAGSRVKVILSRTRPQLVQRLFEQEIPEIADGVIEIRAMAREPGYRSKVAVSSSDQRVDCVGACVGVRGNRIKNIVDELAGERIDIVRWSDDLQVLIPNALQPAEVEEVILCQMLGRAIVLVREDQLSLAIGRRGQNVRLASKLCGWDIEIMTREELDESIERAVVGFSSLEGVDESLSEKLVGEGFLSYDDLSIIEPDSLMEMGELSEDQVTLIIEQAEAKAQEAEQAAAIERRRQREQERIDAATAAAEAAEAAEREAQAQAAAAQASDAPPADSGNSAAAESAEAPGSEADSVEADSAGAESAEAESAEVESDGAEEAAARPPASTDG
jgi:N utilization substance protein A